MTSVRGVFPPERVPGASAAQDGLSLSGLRSLLAPRTDTT